MKIKDGETLKNEFRILAGTQCALSSPEGSQTAEYDADRKISLAINGELMTALLHLMKLRHEDLHDYTVRHINVRTGDDGFCEMHLGIPPEVKELNTIEKQLAKYATMERFMRRLIKEKPDGGFLETQVDYSDYETRVRYQPIDLAKALEGVATKVFPSDSFATSHIMMAKMLMERFDRHADFIPARHLN